MRPALERAWAAFEFMTDRMRQVLKLMRTGHLLWRYSSSGTGYLTKGTYRQVVRQCVIDKMISGGVIEEDNEQSFYRAESGSDLVYKIVKS
jgi:hypothetical protein